MFVSHRHVLDLYLGQSKIETREDAMYIYTSTSTYIKRSALLSFKNVYEVLVLLRCMYYDTAILDDSRGLRSMN